MSDENVNDDRATAAPAGLLGDPRVRLGAFVAILALAAFVLGNATDLSVEGLRELVDRAGVAAPLVFLVVYVVLTVLLLPAWVASAASGLLFGVVFGTVLTVIGATVGAAISFTIGRRLGRSSVERLTGGRVAKLDRWMNRRGLVAVLYVRLIPLFPFSLVNFAAGLTSVKRRDYLLGTAVGIVPGSFAYAALGGNLDDPTSPVFLSAVALVVVLLVAGPFVAKRMDPGDAPGVQEDEPVEVVGADR